MYDYRSRTSPMPLRETSNDWQHRFKAKATLAPSPSSLQSTQSAEKTGTWNPPITFFPVDGEDIEGGQGTTEQPGVERGYQKGQEKA